MNRVKRICLLLVLCCLTGCASAGEAVPSGTPAAQPETAAGEAALPESEAMILPDFTVETVEGGEFTLSEALEEHELVLINLFATWCGPCRMEFPYLEEAWKQREDSVAVIALSVEQEDTPEALREFAGELGLTFPVARAEGTDLERFVTTGIPTTLLIDRAGQVAGVEVGAKSSAGEFLALFDGFTGEDYDPARCSYTVHAYDGDYGPVEGVILNFCTDLTCTPVTTDASGTAVFEGPPARYHVQILSAPDGLAVDGPEEFTTAPWGQTYYIPFTEAGQ